MIGPSALGHLLELMNRGCRHARTGKRFFVLSYDLSYLSYERVTIVVLTYMLVLDNRNTFWLRYTAKQTSLVSAPNRRMDANCLTSWMNLMIGQATGNRAVKYAIWQLLLVKLNGEIIIFVQLSNIHIAVPSDFDFICQQEGRLMCVTHISSISSSIGTRFMLSLPTWHIMHLHRQISVKGLRDPRAFETARTFYPWPLAQIHSCLLISNPIPPTISLGDSIWGNTQ